MLFILTACIILAAVSIYMFLKQKDELIDEYNDAVLSNGAKPLEAAFRATNHDKLDSSVKITISNGVNNVGANGSPC